MPESEEGTEREKGWKGRRESKVGLSTDSITEKKSRSE